VCKLEIASGLSTLPAIRLSVNQLDTNLIDLNSHRQYPNQKCYELRSNLQSFHDLPMDQKLAVARQIQDEMMDLLFNEPETSRKKQGCHFLNLQKSQQSRFGGSTLSQAFDSQQ
jgi:hypothetical protein